MDIGHFTHGEINEARKNVLPPVREVQHQRLQGVESQSAQLLVHVDCEPVRTDGILSANLRPPESSVVRSLTLRP